jgi:hypothetical protein
MPSFSRRLCALILQQGTVRHANRAACEQ